MDKLMDIMEKVIFYKLINEKINLKIIQILFLGII